MPPRKRDIDVIDLISSDSDDAASRPGKRVATSNRTGCPGRVSARVSGITPSNPQRSVGASAIPGPASQRFPSSYTEADDDLIDLTQAPDGPLRELYGTLDNKIVGVRYYNGYAAPGEVVICLREPNNQYDSNAIRVCNVMGVQIGHLPRKVVEKLAPYVAGKDRDEISIEAVLSGEKGMFDCPIRLHIYGTSNPVERLQLEEKLKKDKLLKATQLKQTRAEAEAQRKMLGIKGSHSTVGLNDDPMEPEVSLEQLAQASQAVQGHNRGDAVKSFIIDEDVLSQMPMAEQPAALESQLLPYQLQGLAWLTAKENPQLPPKGSSESIQLWKWQANGRGMYNIATNFHVQGQPKLLSGGILADDMGLGKTLQVISLILTGGPGPTLIVAPLSVMSNWEQQIRRHVKQEHLPKIFIYHGTNKTTKAGLAEHQVIITSYHKLATEGKLAADGRTTAAPLMATNWRRVVLDEGHTIRNAKTKAAVAATSLIAQSKWVLTGTPIINNIKDFQSLLQFLSITGGVEQPVIFTTVIARPLAQGDKTAEALLQLLMRDLCLRRKKDMKFVDLKLPPKKEYVHRISFKPDEKSKYDALLSEAKGALEDFRSNRAGEKGKFQSVLERLLRLRQVCNHWTLCRQRIDDLLKVLEDQTVVALNQENIRILQEALRLYIETQEDCAVCLDTLNSPVITHCKHVFCRTCITRVIETQHRCPMCRNELQEGSLLEPAPEGGEEDDDFDSDAKSSKTEALLKIIQATTKDPNSKVIVFSQWTSFLNIIQNQIAEAGYRYARIDGSMPASKRDAAIHALDHDPDTRVLLASLAVCSVGLNLVSADTVILADSWWAPAIEDQAVDRVHRLGQKRPTTVWRLVMEGTVEERVLDIQHEKRTLVGKAFQEKGKGKKTQETRMADIQKLLG
ncbi:Helicase-like transcription factor [Colletotrichum chlorophyti]|uniref:Helicase-like transcription factor n=1 Tax=Colletotrichum chlorophyti TaxID=708187 RepID=A0A1Q8RUV3_9PEZI|nr:Helicase-like transcription factor [Colletotrichum chlorophyti]